MIRLPRSSTLFPYTTLFRSAANHVVELRRRIVGVGRAQIGGRQDDRLALAQRELVGRDRGRVVDVGKRDQRGHRPRSEEHTSELQSLASLVCRLLLEKKKDQ